MTEHPIFRDGGDQLTMLMALLDAFPGQAGNPDVLVPIHPRVRQAWAQALINRGVVVVPDLMTEMPVGTGEHPEAAAWLQPQQWVKREEYEQQAAARAEAAPASTPEQQYTQAEQMLRAVKPSLADQIAAMTDPEQRAAMAAQLEKDIPRHIDVVRAAQEQLEKARRKAQAQEAPDDE
ncbi:hypothetical protein [Nocardia brasiliensis]|uniref:hypothetical protein n=1 Tax=Nocardia brasiliensis TaxID=37326 RepID=UPI0004A6D515|nr:hypothetical protein [Nocardia brasiliensis]